MQLLKYIAIICLTNQYLLINGYAQENQASIPKYSVSAMGGYGFVIPHRPAMENILMYHIPTLDITIEKHTDGSHSWHHDYSYPSIGIAYRYGKLGDNKKLGSFHGIQPTMKFNLSRNNRHSLQLIIGAGIGYVTTIYNQQDNFKNRFVGSHINALLNIESYYQLTLSPKLQLNSGISFTHLSNAAFKTPNLGFNIPSIKLGISYTTGELNKFSNPITETPIIKDEILVVMGGALKENYPSGGQKFRVYTLSTNYWKSITKNSFIGLGVDVFYNSATAEIIEKETDYSPSPFQTIQQGLHLGYQVKISRLSAYFVYGGYLISRARVQGNWYQRIGLSYYIHNNIYIGANLKVHFSTADYAEITLGYRIWKK